MQRSGTGHVQFSRNLRGGTAPQKLQSQSPASLILETFDEQDETKFEPRGIKQLPTPATRTQKSVKSQKRSRSAPAASKKGDRNDRSSTEGKSKLSPQSVASTLLRSSLRRRSRSNTSRKQQQYPYPQKEVQNEQESKDAPRVSNVPGARPHRRSLSLVGNMSPQPQPKKKPSSPRGRSGSPRRILSSFGKILSSISRNASPSRDSQRASMANGGGSGDGDVNGHTSTGATRDQTPVKDTSLDDFVESQSNASASSLTATKTNEATALSRGKKISSMKDHMERPKFASISAPMQEASIVQTRDEETRDTGATPEASLRTNSRIGSSECAGRSARSPRSSMVSRVLNAGGLRGRSKLANRPRPHAATTTTTSSSSSSSSTSSSQQPRASPIPPRSLLQRGRPRQRTPVAGGGGKRRNVGRSGNGGPSWSPTPKKRSVSGSPSPRGPKVPVRKSPIARSPARRTPPQASPSQRSGRSTSPRSKSPNAANAEADGAAKSASNRAPPDITALAMHKATSSSSPRRSQRTPLKTRPVDARGAKKEAIAIDGDGGATMAQEEPSEENPRRAAEGLERVEPRSRPLPVPIERDIAMIPDTLPPAVVACEDISKLSLDEALQRQQRRSDGTDHVLGALRSARTISTPENHPLSVGAVKKSPDVSNQPRTTKSRAVASPHSSPPRITSARPMSPKALAQLPREVNPYQSSSSSSPRTVPSDFANSGESNSALNNGNRSGKSKEQPIITFDGTFRGWTYSSRPEIRLADLVAVDFLGMGHFGQVKCVRWQPKDGSGSRSAGRSPGKDDDDRDGRYKNNGSNVVKRLFALKIMERERFENKVVASGRTEEYYIFNEREIMIDIKSPFHIRLLNTYKSAKNLYMLLEYAPGRNLKDQIDRDMGLTMFGGADANVWSSSSSLDITDATSDLSSEHLEASLSRIKFYAANIVLALRHLHERQIMHRDIKPSNILIDTHGYLKICDYGFARWMAIGEKTGSIAGTYNYLTPEQAVDDEYDHSVDLWCLGVTIYNMCYGVTPFEAPEGTDDWQQVTVDNILNRRVRFLDDRKPLPLAGKMLVKDLLSRFIEKRLGAKLEYDAILSHAWFRDVDWERLEKREVDAPWHPDLHSMHANLT